MILPAAGATIRDGHGNGNGTDGSNTNPQTGMAQTSPAQTPGHGAAPPIVKDALAGGDNGTSQAGPPPHKDTDLNAASVSLATASASAVVPAPANSPAATLPVVAAASVTADLPAKPAVTVPAAASGTTGTPSPPLPEPPVIAAPGPVQMAQMVNRAEQSEMRIGMNTSAFGSVEVRTVVHANDVGLVIGSEKGDLRTLLSNDMPAIVNTLQEKNLTLHSVNFMQGFAFSNNASGGGGSQPQSFAPARMPSAGAGSEAAAEDSHESLPAAEWGGGSGSLSILA
jgi:flagellar hook-length control protein FliK